jgi:hypothetical protein
MSKSATADLPEARHQGRMLARRAGPKTNGGHIGAIANCELVIANLQGFAAIQPLNSSEEG